MPAIVCGAAITAGPASTANKIEEFMRRSMLLLFCLSVLIAAGCCGIPFAFAEGAPAREVATTVSPVLVSDGVHAVVTAVPGDAVQNPDAPVAIVFVSYEQAFRGTLILHARDRGGADIAVSAAAKVNEPAESGGHVHFVFEKGTALEKAASFSLDGEKIVIREAPPAS